jgi:hypothetical protein
VPGTSQLLVLSPMIPEYTVHNRYLNTSTTVRVDGYDARSVRATIPRGAAAYVRSVRTIDSDSDGGVARAQEAAAPGPTTRCYVDFYDTFRVGADVVIAVTSDRAAAQNCDGPVPHSISTGGFATVR